MATAKCEGLPCVIFPLRVLMFVKKPMLTSTASITSVPTPCPPVSVMLYDQVNYGGLKSVETAGYYGPNDLGNPNASDGIRA